MSEIDIIDLDEVVPLDSGDPLASAQAFLEVLKLVDGIGSGLDADLVRSVTPGATGLALLPTATAGAARTVLGLGTADAVAFASLVLGTDPGGSELLRVGGNARFRDEINVNQNDALGVKVAISSAPQYGLGFFSGSQGQATTGLACSSAYGLAEVALGGWDGTNFNRYLYAGPRTGGAVVIGTDPGGSELLRVGGKIRAQTAKGTLTTLGDVIAFLDANFG